MKTTFECPGCKKRLAVDSSAAGKSVKCPACSRVVIVPVSAAPQAPPGGAQEIVCQRCGTRNPAANDQCSNCGLALYEPTHTLPDTGLSTLIPYKNSLSLWAYYTGVFSLAGCMLPVIGFAAGLAPVILGIKALKYAKEHPDAGGKGHAWTGIILGGIVVTLQTILIIFIIIGAIFGR